MFSDLDLLRINIDGFVKIEFVRSVSIFGIQINSG